MSDAAGTASDSVRELAVARPLAGAVPTVAAALSLVATGHPVAVIAAGFVVFAWVWSSAVAAFGVGQVGLAAVAGTATPESLVLAQGALAACLFVPVVRARRSVRHVFTTTVALAGLGAVVAGAWFATGSVWTGAAAVVAVTATVSYVLHRYSLLWLGELSDE